MVSPFWWQRSSVPILGCSSRTEPQGFVAGVLVFSSWLPAAPSALRRQSSAPGAWASGLSSRRQWRPASSSAVLSAAHWLLRQPAGPLLRQMRSSSTSHLSFLAVGFSSLASFLVRLPPWHFWCMPSASTPSACHVHPPRQCRSRRAWNMCGQRHGSRVAGCQFPGRIHGAPLVCVPRTRQLRKRRRKKTRRRWCAFESDDKESAVKALSPE
mmetsp:Transcript_32573/g.82338  ORF Transcript_32573/g.82338 Transcript_32573/m.82338 type:complete len:212 (-) Transcript_32573:356-991(-)